jgi:hypothetical protein
MAGSVAVLTGVLNTASRLAFRAVVTSLQSRTAAQLDDIEQQKVAARTSAPHRSPLLCVDDCDSGSRSVCSNTFVSKLIVRFRQNIHEENYRSHMSFQSLTLIDMLVQRKKKWSIRRTVGDRATCTCAKQCVCR